MSYETFTFYKFIHNYKGKNPESIKSRGKKYNTRDVDINIIDQGSLIPIIQKTV